MGRNVIYLMRGVTSAPGWSAKSLFTLHLFFLANGGLRATSKLFSGANVYLNPSMLPDTCQVVFILMLSNDKDIDDDNDGDDGDFDEYKGDNNDDGNYIYNDDNDNNNNNNNDNNNDDDNIIIMIII